jgi:hypothetical protein
MTMRKNPATIFLRASENSPDPVAISPAESETNHKELARRAATWRNPIANHAVQSWNE